MSPQLDTNLVWQVFLFISIALSISNCSEPSPVSSSLQTIPQWSQELTSSPNRLRKIEEIYTQFSTLYLKSIIIFTLLSFSPNSGKCVQTSSINIYWGRTTSQEFYGACARQNQRPQTLNSQPYQQSLMRTIEIRNWKQVIALQWAERQWSDSQSEVNSPRWINPSPNTYYLKSSPARGNFILNSTLL